MPESSEKPLVPIPDQQMHEIRERIKEDHPEVFAVITLSTRREPNGPQLLALSASADDEYTEEDVIGALFAGLDPTAPTPDDLDGGH